MHINNKTARTAFYFENSKTIFAKDIYSVLTCSEYFQIRYKLVIEA